MNVKNMLIAIMIFVIVLFIVLYMINIFYDFDIVNVVSV